MPAIFVPQRDPKTHETLTFLATIRIDHPRMKALAVISILALLTISGAAYTDAVLTSSQPTHAAN